MKDLFSEINMLDRMRDYNNLYSLVEDQLKHESNDIEFWIKLAIAIIIVPIVDYEKSIECLNKAESGNW